MGSRLDVSPFLLSANSSNRSSRDSRTEMALSLPLILPLFPAASI
jgi:hypothetical protein